MSKNIHFIALLFCFFLGVAGYYLGMAASPDSYTYLAMAKQMLQGEYFSKNNPLSEFRMFGYPYMLSLFMDFFEGYYEYTVLYFQLLLYLISALFGYLCLKKQSDLDSVSIFILIFISMSLVWLSFCYLTDSLANSFIILSISIILWQFQKVKINSLSIFISGIFWLLAFLLRDSVLFLSLTPIFILFFHQWVHEKWCFKQLLLCGVFIIPIFVGYCVVAQINQSRTGYFYITTGSQTVMLQSLEKVAKKNPEVFNTDSDLDRLARETYRNYIFPETLAINSKLKKTGYNSHQIVEIVGQKYRETWRRYPVGMIEKIWNELRIDRVIFGTFAPWRAFRRFWIWRYQEDVRTELPGYADKILKTLSAVLSASIMLPFMIYLLISAGKFCLRRQMTSSQKSALIYGCAYFGFLMPFAMSHSELRYVWGASLLPLAVFCFAWKDWMPLFSKYIPTILLKRKSAS